MKLSPEQEITRAREAKRLLETPLLAEALSVMDKAIYEAWKASSERDGKGMKNLLLMAKAHDRFVGLLKSHMETGELAAHQLKTSETLQDKWQEVKRRGAQLAGEIRKFR